MLGFIDGKSIIRKIFGNHTKKYIVIYIHGSDNRPLILGQCNDDSKFTTVNQAINKAK